jgi:hypothetical protein
LNRRLTGPSEAFAQRAAQRQLRRPRVLGGVDVLPPAAGRQLDGPQGPCLGQVGHGTGQAVVAFAGCPVLAAEHLGREQERAAVDGRLVQVLAEGDHRPVHHHPDPSSRFPGRPIRGGIDEHGRLTGLKQPGQRSLSEDMVGGDQQEQRVALDLALDRSQ